MTIIIATDGKPHSMKALDYAFRYAKAFPEPLYVIRVVTTRVEVELEKILDESREMFDELKARAQAEGLEMHTLLEYGPPAESVLALAERMQASVVIVGSSDKSALDRMMMDSVSEHLVRHADCTVIVAR